jgi:citrate lyase subunit beta/citryl-CoA lyase
MVSEPHAPICPLFVPGDRPDRFAKAAASGADAVIFDLEDAVSPDAKAAAREAVVRRDPIGLQIIVRINASDTAWFPEDIAALVVNPPDIVMLAKAEQASDLAYVRSTCGGRVGLIPLVETARGLAGLDALLRAEGVVVAAFGSLDFALDLGCDHEWDALPLMRSELVLRSRLAGLAPPIDGVTTDLDSPVAVETEARRARALGFGGKLAIHPRQTAPISNAFRSSPEDIAWTHRVMASLDGRGAQRVDGKMIDRPVVERARRILARNRSPA